MAQTTIHGQKLIFTNRVIGNTVYMLLNQGIGPDPENPNEPYIDGSRFADELYYWKGEGKQIEVKINTWGGRVDHGWNMIDAIQECQADTFDAGVAYSMGGMCLLFGRTRKAYEYSMGMIHAPRGGSKTSLDIVKGQFRTVLETRTKFKKAEIDEMMESGKNYFFSASEMLAKGIIDEIVTSGKSLTPPENASAKDLYAFYNNYIEDKKPNLNMKNIFASFFKKETEEEAIVAAAEMRSENESLKAQITAKDTEITNLKAKVKESEDAAKAVDAKAKATEMIEAAEKAGKLSFAKDTDGQAAKAKAIQNAIANPEATKALLDGIKPQKTVAAAEVPNKEEKKVEMTYAYLADKDPKKLQEIADTDPKLYAKLVEEYHDSIKNLKK